MKQHLIASLLAAVTLYGHAFSAAPTGWACFAVGGDVYRAPVGGSRELLADNVGAKHACWSWDGSLIFYIVSGGDIYAMNNDGSDRRKIGNADDKRYSAIAAYRPENRSVLCVDGRTFYKINADDKDKVAICAAGASVDGEIAISRDGTKIAYRSGDSGGGGKLKKLTVGGSPTGYAGNCSASLSPNGRYLTENQSGHTELKVIDWDGGSSTLDAGTIGHWDNQAFAVNSDTWICAMDDDPKTNDNVGYGVGIVSTGNDAYMVTSWSGSTVQYPRFFVGDLPDVSSPATYELSVVNGSGDGTYEAGEQVNISADSPADGKVFDQWTGDVGGVADVGDPTTTYTMPASNASITATYKDAPVPEYTLTVTNGTGDGSYTAGTAVDIDADTPPSGQVFDRWTGDVSYVADANASQTTVTMPEANVSLTATYKDAPPTEYSLSVTNGTGDGSYTAGTAVDIDADTPPSGQVFDRWTGDVSYVADVNASQTTVTMPETNVSLTATYKDASLPPQATAITSPQEGDILTEGVEITLTAEGSNLRWSYDANSDKLGEIDIGEGNTVAFTIPTNVSGPMTITIFCTGDNGSDQVECGIGQATASGGRGSDASMIPADLSWNPRGFRATITFSLMSAQHARLRVYDSRGELIKGIADRPFGPGLHSVVWDGRNASGTPIAGGMYTLVLQTTSGVKSWRLCVRR
jgi:hypothetical protein